MTLFYTLTQYKSFILFAYLGLFCGVLFEFIKTLLNAFSFYLSKKISSRELIATKTNKKHKFKNLIIKLKINFNVIINKLFNIFSSIFLPLIFLLETVVCFFVNLKYNLGILSVICICAWIAFFYMGKSLTKTVAKFIISFYNYLVKKVKIKNEK